MSSAIKEILAGVGATIVISTALERGLPTIVELRTKRSTNKIAGQRSIPMETVEPRWERHMHAYARLVREEIHLRNLKLDGVSRRFLGCIEVAPGIVLYNRLFQVPPEVAIVEGSESAEVGGLKWTRFEQVLDTAPRNGHLSPWRPGLYEAVYTAWQFLTNPDNFTPRVYRHYQLRDRNPREVFDLVERGLTADEAMSLLGLSWQPAGEFVALGR